MPDQVHLILVINPGSTSTKAALYEDDKQIAVSTIRHLQEDFSGCRHIWDQKDIRMKGIVHMLDEKGINGSQLSAVVGRGGLLKPIDSGTYLINEKMTEDLIGDAASVHASALGGLIAGDLGKRFQIPAFVVDPIVVDEMDPSAKLTGLPGIERRSVFHALNTKAVARRCAEELGVNYEDGRFVVAHMGGGITVGAHRYGRVIDVNDALSGEGAFTPERSGSLPLEPIIRMCFSGKYDQQEMLDMVNKRGGIQAYLGTNDLVKVEKMIKEGDEYAALVVDSMAYQVSKEIGAMAAALEGRVNAIILTGGLAYSARFTGSIKQRVDQMARIFTYPGEHEMEALSQGALRVLQGKERVSNYV